ncbi:MAG: branched-chain-amino-acid transaminase [Planctomycetota bacterium]|jgi:branched-chain amino acid aminotransferase
MGRKIYIDGKLVEESEAKVSVFDHGLLYGDGIFEGMRAYAGRVFKLGEHLERLYASGKAISLEIPMSREDVASAIEKTMQANSLRDAYIRLVVTRGVGDLGLDPRKCPKPSVIIIAASIELYPEDLYENGLEIITGSTRRISPSALNPRIKSCNYLNNILAKIEGIRAGVMEVLMLNDQGRVAECTGDNVFRVAGRTIETPPADAGILEGVTRNAVMELAREAGFAVRERDLTLYDLYVAEEVFLTGTAAEIIAVTKIDGRAIGGGKPGPVTGDLRSRFRKLVTSPA